MINTLPESFKKYYQSLCLLSYEDKPDYNGLKSCIHNEVAKLNQYYDETDGLFAQPLFTQKIKNADANVQVNEGILDEI